jgi:hypothetical protein
MTFPKEMLDLADQRAKEKMKFENNLWNLQINANIFLAAVICNCLYSQTVIKGQISDTRGKVIVSASVSIYKNHHLLSLLMPLQIVRVCLQLPFPVLILK